jgi:hypothetical protein
VPQNFLTPQRDQPMLMPVDMRDWLPDDDLVFVRTQFAHLIDIVPTVLDALGLTPPTAIRGVTQSPIHGISFAHTFDDATAATRHRTQYYEMLGHRAIDHDGGRAVCPWPGPSFTEAGKPFGAPITAEILTDLDAHHWELYHVATDPAENHNVADQHREKLIELIAMWYAEAGKYNVLPVDGSAVERLLVERPQIAEPRAQYTYRPGTQTVGFFAAPRVLNRPHAITADVELPVGGAEGVLLCQGSSSGGWSFYVKGGKLCYTHNYLSRATYQVSAPESLPTGRHQLRFEFEPTGAPDIPHGKGSPGRGQLYLDGRLIAEEEFPVTTAIAFNPGGLTCGANPGSAITTDYTAPLPFTGTLHTVTVDLSGELITDTDSEMRLAMARQ